MLTPEQRDFWQENGYLVLPNFFSEAAIDKLIKVHENIWHECPKNVIVDDLVTNRRCSMYALSEAEKEHKFKVNDLYLNYQTIRDLSLNKKLVDILTGLLQESPVLCNTLSLDYGTQQFLHVDSLYMTPLTDHHLVATWIALEDCHPDAGPLCYVPGSHKIPIYRFSTGSAHVVNEEFPQWQEYIQQNVNEYGLSEEFFLPKKGSVFIWHAQLLHGGSPTKNFQLTRKSLVSHYFTKSDCLQLQSKVVSFGKGFWMDKPPLVVNENDKDNPLLVNENDKDSPPLIVDENNIAPKNRQLKNILAAKVEQIFSGKIFQFKLSQEFKNYRNINFKPTAKGCLSGYFDLINNSTTPIKVSKATSLNASGWAILPDEGRPADKVLITYGENNSLVTVDCVELERQDVVNVLQNPAYKNSGWNATFILPFLPTESIVIKAWAYNCATKEATQLKNTHEIVLVN